MAEVSKLSGVRQLRLSSGLTQVELAARAGVSRQLVAAVEAGQNTPSVDAALRLAHALGTSVEELFADAEPASIVSALGDRLSDGAPLRVGRVGGQFVAAALPDHGVAGDGWARSDGVLEAGKLRLFPGANPTGLVLAGCDPAIGVAEAMLQGLGPRSLIAVSASTGTALRALERGGVHAAVVHGPQSALPSPVSPVIRLHLARWRVGLAVPSSLRRQSFESLLGGAIKIVQRDAAAASQQAFRRAALAAGIGVPTVGPRATGHIDAARRAATLGCGAVTTESAARAFELAFRPLEEHTVEIWFAGHWREHPGVATLAELLNGAAFTERLGQFGAYDLTGCGSRLSG